MNNLKKLRQRYKLSVRELSSRCGVGFAYISKLEKGEFSLTMKTLNKFTSYFGVTSDYILGKSDVGFFVSFKDKGKECFTTISEIELNEYISKGWITEYADTAKVYRFVANDSAILMLTKEFELNENGKLVEPEKTKMPTPPLTDLEMFYDYMELTEEQKALVRSLIKNLLKGR